jgi:hypothetical protein
MAKNTHIHGPKHQAIVISDDGDSDVDMLSVPSLIRSKRTKVTTSRLFDGNCGSDTEFSDGGTRQTRLQKRRADGGFKSDTESLRMMGLPPPNPKTDIGKVDQLLFDVYRDIDDIYVTVAYQWRTWNYLNPFPSYADWPAHIQERYHRMDEKVGREYLAVVMQYAPNFFLPHSKLYYLTGRHAPGSSGSCSPEETQY